MNKQILIQFSKKIRKERLKRGISQERLSELAKVHQTYISAIECAEKIAHALGKQVSDLVNF